MARETSKLPRQAGAGSGIHRLKVNKSLPTESQEERKCGGKVKRACGGQLQPRTDGGKIQWLQKAAKSRGK